jgi:hypothetical protein
MLLMWTWGLSCSSHPQGGSDASLPICFDDVEELIVDGAHVLFADVGDCRWAEPCAGADRNGGF